MKAEYGDIWKEEIVSEGDKFGGEMRFWRL